MRTDEAVAEARERGSALLLCEYEPNSVADHPGGRVWS